MNLGLSLYFILVNPFRVKVTSPKRIDREDLGESLTGISQDLTHACLISSGPNLIFDIIFLQDPIKQPLLKRLAGQEELAQMATQTFLDILFHHKCLNTIFIM